MESSPNKGSVEQIKVEPDFYFPLETNEPQEDEDNYCDEDDLEDLVEVYDVNPDSPPAKQKIHTGEKPFRCEICNLRFTQSCNLQSHYRRNHGVDPKVSPGLFNRMRHASAMAPFKTSNSKAWSAEAQRFTNVPKSTHLAKQPFRCCVCEEPFFDIDLLHIHEETHVPEAPFECRYCLTLFSILEEFRSHIRIHRVTTNNLENTTQQVRQPQPGIRAFDNRPVGMRKNQSPPAMEATTSNAVLNANQPFVASNDVEYPYKCVECKRNYQKHELYSHMKVHLKQKNIFSKKSLKCEKCGKVFEKVLTLKKHMDTAHPTLSSSRGENSLLLEALQADTRRSLSPQDSNTGNKQTSKSELPVESSIKQEPESALGEDEINSTVSDNPILTQLLNSNNEISTKSNSVSRNTTPVHNTDGDVSSEGGFIISAVASVDHSFLQQLEQLERNQQPESASDDSNQAETSQRIPQLRRMPVLEESLRRPPVVSSAKKSITMPLSSGPYSCSFCGKVFNEHFGFRQHMRAMHYSEKRHRCKECGKKFTLGITLATHMRIHTAVQPFTCIVCFKTFARSTSLNGHLSSHSHGRLKCAECGEMHANVFNYMKHIEKFHPNFFNNVASYRKKAESVLNHRRELVLEITRGLAKYRSEIPNVLARLRGELPPNEVADINDDVEVTSSEQIRIKQESADSAQSEVVSSASEEQETKVKLESLPALRAELRKRPLRSNTHADDIDEAALSPPRKSARLSSNSPNLKRLLEQSSSGEPDDASQQDVRRAVKSEPVE